MLPRIRWSCLLLLALPVSHAGAESSLHRFEQSEASAVFGTNLSFDRYATVSEAFWLPADYSVPVPLERSACSDYDKRRQLRGRIAPRVVQAASEQLNLPMGTGRFLSVLGRPYLFCLEPHYREPGTGGGPEGWHKGVTVYDASDAASEVASERT